MSDTEVYLYDNDKSDIEISSDDCWEWSPQIIKKYHQACPHLQKSKMNGKIF